MSTIEKMRDCSVNYVLPFGSDTKFYSDIQQVKSQHFNLNSKGNE
jgi:hypothetical protein